MKRNLVILFLGLNLVWVWSSCTKNLDNFGPQNTTDGADFPALNRTLVLNEGNFMFGNGSLSILNNESRSVSQNVFSEANGFPLGDVPQSLVFNDSLGYIVVNNSGKIEIVNQSDFTSIGTISGFTSPRYLSIKSIQPLTAYVTDLYANKIWVVNLESQSIVGDIPFSGWGEEMIQSDQTTLVLNKTDSLIYLINNSNNTLWGTMNGFSEVIEIEKWGDSEILVLTTQGLFLSSIDGSNPELIVDMSNRTPSKMAGAFDNHSVYFLDNGLFQVDLTTKQVSEVLSLSIGSYYYGVYFNPHTSEIVVLDAKDFVQDGDAIVIPSNEEKIEIFKVGINPQFVAFD